MRPMTALHRAVPLLLVLVALLACKKSSSDSTPTPTQPTATAATVPGVCPKGTSMDPGQGEFRPAVTAFKDKDYKTAQRLLEHLMKQYPNSATLRVWRGDAALFDKTVKEDAAADAAIPFYEEAEKLHDKGCALPEYEHYYLRMGVAYALLRKKSADDAIRHLDVAKKNWDNSAEVFYHLARAHCRKSDVDQCATNFEKSLEIAKSLRRPKFLRSHNSLDDWIRRSRTQSEFGPLRRDKRYSQIIKKMKDDG
jgi:tetratricopeptide (TPR) repeat protein